MHVYFLNISMAKDAPVQHNLISLVVVCDSRQDNGCLVFVYTVTENKSIPRLLIWFEFKEPNTADKQHLKK